MRGPEGLSGSQLCGGQTHLTVAGGGGQTGPHLSGEAISGLSLLLSPSLCLYYARWPEGRVDGKPVSLAGFRRRGFVCLLMHPTDGFLLAHVCVSV